MRKFELSQQMKAEPNPLIPRKSTENLELLILFVSSALILFNKTLVDESEIEQKFIVSRESCFTNKYLLYIRKLLYCFSKQSK